MKRKATVEEQVIRRLDVIINLLLDESADEEPSSAPNKIRRLTRLGVSTAEVAQMVGKTDAYVKSVLATHQKSRKGKK